MRSTAAIFAALAVCAAVAAQDAGAPAPYPHEAHFASDPAPEAAGVQGNPLDFAGALIGQDVRNFELPRGHEGQYRFACRFHVIDQVSTNPLYMKRWAEDSARAIGAAHARSGLPPVAEALEILRGCPATLPEQGPDVEPAAAEFEAALKGSSFTPRYRTALSALFRGFAEARSLSGRCRIGLTEEDLAFFASNPGYYVAPDGARMPSLTGSVDTHMEFVERARRARIEFALLAALRMQAALAAYVESTKTFKPSDFHSDPAASMLRFRATTRAGTVVVAGIGPDRHVEDCDLLVDTGGDDRWENNAGGCESIATAAAMAIDHFGDDVYFAPSRNYVQGFGFLGAGLLADLSGSDAYEARHFCQGAGILGAGILFDSGGDDRYVAHAFCQGAGAFGLGGLFDNSGEDFYDCATLGQAGATTLGLGLLSDLSGDDRYHLKIGPGKDALGNMAGYGQGGALSWRPMPWRGRFTPYGGAGLLVDSKGNDRYRSGGWCDQGGSYIMSLGALVDIEGNDHYSAGTGQGSGIHITNAILVDMAGHDVYEGGFRTGGSGSDRSPGFLIDYSGNDVYKAGKACYGTGCKPFSYSLFIDYSGDDLYISQNPKAEIKMNDWDSFGGVWPESSEHLWPYAICLDLGGKDDYQVRNRKNDSRRHSFGHGIHIDMEWAGGDVIGAVEPPMEKCGPFAFPPEVESSACADGIRFLSDPCQFVRFRAAGSIASNGVRSARALAAVLAVSRRRQFNRDALECLHMIMMSGADRPQMAKAVAPLLKAADPEVRTIIADDIAVFSLPGLEPALLEAARGDPDAQVRRFALSSLASAPGADAVEAATSLAREDPSPDVRRMALFLVDKSLGADAASLLTSAMESDPSPGVRVAAADMLSRQCLESSAPALRKAAGSFDFYMRRAAAKGLMNLGDADALGILIDSLEFPSIDAFFNYDYNVPNFISAYSGHDLPGDDRYDRRKWREWFESNRGSIDVKANAAAFRALEKLLADTRADPPALRIEALESHLKLHPADSRAKKTLASVLNNEAWNMVTAAEGAPGRDVKTGLNHARRCVELDPQPGYVDTLAEALLAAGEFEAALLICEEMLIQHPGDRGFAERRDRCKKALSDRGGK